MLRLRFFEIQKLSNALQDAGLQDTGQAQRSASACFRVGIQRIFQDCDGLCGIRFFATADACISLVALCAHAWIETAAPL